MLNRMGSNIDPSVDDLDQGSGSLDRNVYFPVLQVAFNQIYDGDWCLNLGQFVWHSFVPDCIEGLLQV